MSTKDQKQMEFKIDSAGMHLLHPPVKVDKPTIIITGTAIRIKIPGVQTFPQLAVYKFKHDNIEFVVEPKGRLPLGNMKHVVANNIKELFLGTSPASLTTAQKLLD